MKAQIYVVPVAMTEEGLITDIEIYIPDLTLIVSVSGSQIIDNNMAEEKYSELKIVKEIDIDDESDIALYKELKDILSQKDAKEIEIFNRNNILLETIADEMATSPHIHIPTPGEISQLSDDFSGNSGLILEN